MFPQYHENCNYFLQVIKPGVIDSRPVKGDTVTVRAAGRLDDGKEVDVHDELTFTIGDSEVTLLNSIKSIPNS